VREHLVRVSDERGKHSKLEWGQRQRPPLNLDRPLGEVHRDETVAVGRRGSGVAARPTEICLDPCEKLLTTEGFRDVVVGSAAEAPNLGQFLGLSREHHYRYVAQLADPLERPPAVEPGHRDVENDEIRASQEKSPQTLVAVSRLDDIVPGPLE